MEHVGGHQALDFVNTLGGRPDEPDDEYLFDYSDLLTFVERSALLDADTVAALRRTGRERATEASGVLDRALRLRRCLDSVLRAHLEGGTADGTAPDGVRAAYTDALQHAHLRRTDDRYDWAWPDCGLECPLWPLALQAVELLRSAPLHRLRQCAHCRWLFLDLSRNHSRRWCSMNACGAILKMRRYRAARRP
jgi:predicted RNA-binding Zn ribbon-like protein